MEYDEFILSKGTSEIVAGFDVDPVALNSYLFDFQRDLVVWALRKGKAALFAECGLGKSLMQLSWADAVCRHMQAEIIDPVVPLGDGVESDLIIPGCVLILAPLAVAQQTLREAERFGMEARVCESARDVGPGINITNYQKLHLFDVSVFDGVVLDECFSPFTSVDVFSLDFGRVSKYIKDVECGDLIFNASGVDRVSDVHRREVDYAVKIKVNGREIVSSPNHPYFTRRGWIGAQDLQPGDAIITTPSAMRMVRGYYPSSESGQLEEEVLRDILLSEMADESPGTQGTRTYAGDPCKDWDEGIGLASLGRPASEAQYRAYSGTQSDAKSRDARKSLPPIERDEAQTFRAWGQREGIDRAATDSPASTRKELAGGISFVTGETNSRLSDELQIRHRKRQSQNRYRSGWRIAPQSETPGPEEGCKGEFVRVDSLEVLEPGHLELERLRDPDGHVYLYDIGASRHPSFSVNGLLVHNSSILKSFDGKTRTALIESFQRTPYRLACTATPAPNDHMELGNHAEFLGVMSRTEMLAMYFVHDGGDTSQWRLKGHGEQPFWKWVASWGVMVRKPSDLGYDDTGYDLPALRLHESVIQMDQAEAFDNGQLFATMAHGLMDQRKARKSTMADRIERCAELVNNSDESWIVWCELNEEGDQLAKAISGAVQVAGADSDAMKTHRMMGFVEGRNRVLVTKAKIAGFGMNFQHCHNIAFVGVSHSWEQFYQAVRRCWRFGQKSEVHVHMFAGEAEGAVLASLQKKQAQADVMADKMLSFAKSIQTTNVRRTEMERMEYERDCAVSNGYSMYLGDCVEVTRELPDDSIHYSIFSPPFASLYVYSNSERDMGNVRDDEEFATHLGYLIDELFRVIMPGRLVSFHCMNLPTSKTHDGYIGIKDFRGNLIRAFQERGFIYHSEVCIWKDPVTAMQRTKALGLLHKQIKKDSCMSRQGIADYLVTMRKPGDNPERVTHTNDSFPVHVWQRYASPVWDDIDANDTLQYRAARDNNDERHICPLQLGVIRRGINLWTNPGDTVLSPFGGIASEGYVALEMGRKYIGIELKPSYWKQAVRNLNAASEKANELSLMADDGMGLGL